jgi:glycosyltransferase involved in cell wall biosynthesis
VRGRLPLRSRAGARIRVGWVANGALEGWIRSYRSLPPTTAMRVANMSRWIDGRDRFECELYDSRRRYDIVVFVKTMGGRYEEEARRVQSYGARVVFDANVNYYEVWGEYDVANTKPTEQQQQDAVAITTLADGVVADSSYLLGIVRRLNERSVWIPDNVDPRVFSGVRKHWDADGPFRLVWSGVPKKALPLLTIREALASLERAELVIVSSDVPEAMRELEEAIPCRFVPFIDLDRRFVRTLRSCDTIISPKRLVNSYELGHAEYKITVGMAVGLPAVASPQQSYVEAIGHLGGGILANDVNEWQDALQRLAADVGLRASLGAKGAQTVAEVYATPTVAQRYLAFLRQFV